MCELSDINRLEMPGKWPCCMEAITVKGQSLYVQIWKYACHITTAKACAHTYTGILTGNEITGPSTPNDT